MCDNFPLTESTYWTWNTFVHLICYHYFIYYANLLIGARHFTTKFTKHDFLTNFKMAVGWFFSLDAVDSTQVFENDILWKIKKIVKSLSTCLCDILSVLKQFFNICTRSHKPFEKQFQRTELICGNFWETLHNNLIPRRCKRFLNVLAVSVSL